MIWRWMGTIAIMVFGSMAACEAEKAPPNEPGKIGLADRPGVLRLTYNGAVIADVTVCLRVDEKTLDLDEAGIQWITSEAASDARSAVLCTHTESRGDRDQVEQVLTFRLQGMPEAKLHVEARIHASGEAIAAETMSPAQTRFPLIRNSVGASCNLRNNAVYDRRSDWVLLGPGDGATTIMPSPSKAAQFAMTIEGDEITITFRPRYYGKHKGLRYYEPWNYRVWQEPVAGWCSWWAYKNGVTETIVAEAVWV
jgi:hypothetical protein